MVARRRNRHRPLRSNLIPDKSADLVQPAFPVQAGGRYVRPNISIRAVPHQTLNPNHITPQPEQITPTHHTTTKSVSARTHPRRRAFGLWVFRSYLYERSEYPVIERVPIRALPKRNFRVPEIKPHQPTNTNPSNKHDQSALAYSHHHHSTHHDHHYQQHNIPRLFGLDRSRCTASHSLLPAPQRVT